MLDYRSELAFYLLQFAQSSTAGKRWAEAERDFRRALELLEAILNEAPERARERIRLARARKTSAISSSSMIASRKPSGRAI